MLKDLKAGVGVQQASICTDDCFITSLRCLKHSFTCECVCVGICVCVCLCGVKCSTHTGDCSKKKNVKHSGQTFTDRSQRPGCVYAKK